MRGRMRGHGAPAVDQGVGEGVVQEGWGLAGFGVGEQPQESCGSSNFNPKDNKATSPIPEEFRVGAFLLPLRVRGGKPKLCQPLVAPFPTVGGRWR